MAIHFWGLGAGWENAGHGRAGALRVHVWPPRHALVAMRCTVQDILHSAACESSISRHCWDAGAPFFLRNRLKARPGPVRAAARAPVRPCQLNRIF